MSSSNTAAQSSKTEAQAIATTDDAKSTLPSLGALDEDDEFEEFDEQGKWPGELFPHGLISPL